MGVDEKESCCLCEGLFATVNTAFEPYSGLANVLARRLLFRYNHFSLAQLVLFGLN
jgi:hypothetical protein